MKHKIETIRYAQGWVGEHIETHNDPLDTTETDAYREKVQEMWTILDEGIEQLASENASLRATLDLIDAARTANL